MSPKSMFADFIRYIFISLTGLGAVVMVLCGNYLAAIGLFVAFVCLLAMPEDVNKIN